VSEARGRRELVELDKTLLSVSELAEGVRRDLVDLEEAAWSQSVSERPERSSRKQGWALSDVGDPRAKLALRELDRTAAAFLAAARQTRNLFVGGPGAQRMLGSDLGDENGQGAEAELTRLLKARDRRRERGEYTPNRVEPQLHVPGSRRR